MITNSLRFLSDCTDNYNERFCASYYWFRYFSVTFLHEIFLLLALNPSISRWSWEGASSWSWQAKSCSKLFQPSFNFDLLSHIVLVPSNGFPVATCYSNNYVLVFVVLSSLYMLVPIRLSFYDTSRGIIRCTPCFSCSTNSRFRKGLRERMASNMQVEPCHLLDETTQPPNVNVFQSSWGWGYDLSYLQGTRFTVPTGYKPLK